MAIDMTLVMLFSLACTYFSFRKLNRTLFKILAFIVIWLTGWIIAIAMGIAVKAYLGESDMGLKYIGNGAWRSLFGCVLGWLTCQVFIEKKKVIHRKRQLVKFKVELNSPFKRVGVALILAYLATFCVLYIYWNFIYGGGIGRIRWVTSLDRFTMEFFSFWPTTVMLWLGVSFYCGYAQMIASFVRVFVKWVKTGELVPVEKEGASFKRKILKITLLLILVFFCLVNIDTSIRHDAFEVSKYKRLRDL